MDTERLAQLILQEIETEFRFKYFSGNLANTLKIYPGEDGRWFVEVPAEIYDIKRYKKTGTIIYTNQGSYASKVNETGGFSGKHKGYIDYCINTAIQKWMKESKIEGKVTM